MLGVFPTKLVDPVDEMLPLLIGWTIARVARRHLLVGHPLLEQAPRIKAFNDLIGPFIDAQILHAFRVGGAMAVQTVVGQEGLDGVMKAFFDIRRQSRDTL